MSIRKQIEAFADRDVSAVHTEDCQDSNDDTSVLFGHCICPDGPRRTWALRHYTIDGRHAHDEIVRDATEVEAREHVSKAWPGAVYVDKYNVRDL